MPNSRPAVGVVRLLLAIIKYCEDVLNVGHDTHYADVRCILLIEDSVRFYSSYMPMLYTEVLEQTQSLMVEGINLSHRLLRLRARPKILLATTYEEAWAFYEDYKESLLGVISDGRFPWNEVEREDAGAQFIKRVKDMDPHTPAVLQSTNREMMHTAAEIGAGFIHKHSRKLLKELRQFMLDNFGFGDFVFRMPDGREIGRISPYLGAGLAWVNEIDIDLEGLGGEYEDLEDDGFGVQVMAGLSYRQSQRLRWDAEVRWLYFDEADLDNAGVKLESVDYNPLTVTLGFSYSF